MATKDEAGMDLLDAKADPMELYNICLDHCSDSPDGQGRLFTQNDLFQIYPACNSNAKELMPLIQYLTDRRFLRTLKAGGVLCWMLRTRDVAMKLSGLTSEEYTVFDLIEDAGTSGVWVKTIKVKSGLTQPTVTKAATTLERKNLVKQIKTVKGPAQRTYMLAHLVPGDDVTGGSFFDAGDLDESLIEEMCNLIVFQVRSQSWTSAKIKRRVKRAREEDDDEVANEHTAKKSKSDDPSANDEYDIKTEQVQLAYQPGTHTYPTVDSIHDFVMNSGVLKTKTISMEEVKSLLNVLIWDGKLEKVGPAGYRTVKGVNYNVSEGSLDMGGYDDGEVGNGATEGPCAKCPVAELCTGDLERGVVSAATCSYFGTWLEV